MMAFFCSGVIWLSENTGIFSGPLNIALSTRFPYTFFRAKLHPEILAATQAVGKQLRLLGHNVVSGNPDAWNDGWITPMGEGDFIGWKNGTGITHAILNNSDNDAVIIVGGERSRLVNQYWYPFHREYNMEIRGAYWADHPVPRLGPHDGLPDALRTRVPARLRRSPVSANEAARHLGKLQRRR